MSRAYRNRSIDPRADGKEACVLVVEAPFPPVARANLRLYRLGRILAKRGYFATMVSPSKRITSEKSGTYQGLSVRQHTGLSDFLYRDRLRLFVRIFHVISGTYFLIGLTKKGSVKAIHAWHPIASLEAVVAGWVTKTPVLLDWTDFYSDIAQHESPMLVPFFRSIESFLLRHSLMVNTVSDEMASALVDIGAQSGKIHVIPDGVDPQVFDPSIEGTGIREKYGLGNSPLAIFHGDTKPIDGVDILLEAFTEVLGRVPSARLLILGGSGAYFEQLKKMAAARHIDSSVVFAGWVPHSEVPRFLAAANVGVMPLRSTLETNCYLSFKLFEYWSMKKPVVVSRVKAISRLVVSGENGILFDPEDTQGLADSLCEIFQNADKARTMGSNGRTLIESSFNWDSLMEREADLYRLVGDPS